MPAKKFQILIFTLDNESVLTVDTSSFEGFRRRFERARSDAWQGGCGEPLFPKEDFFQVSVSYEASSYCQFAAHDVVHGDDILACVAHIASVMQTKADLMKHLSSYAEVQERLRLVRQQRLVTV